MRSGVTRPTKPLASRSTSRTDAHPDLQSLQDDFWLVHSVAAVRMIYDEEGRFEWPELIEDVRPYLLMQATALRHAVPLDEYVASRGLELTT